MLNDLVDNPTPFVDATVEAPLITRRAAGPSLLSIEDVDEIVASGAIGYPLITMSREGRRLDPPRFTFASRVSEPGRERAIRSDLVAREFVAGATVILESLHHTSKRVADYCRGLTLELGTSVEASGYLTPPHSQGLGPHYDTADAFVVQTDGTKKWELFAPVWPRPLESQPFRGIDSYPGLSERLRGEPDFTFVMTPGDVMFLPRGWIHNPFALDETSLHVVLVLHHKTKHWLLERLLQRFAEEQSVRAFITPQSLSTGGAEAAKQSIIDFQDWVQDGGAELVERVAGDMIEGAPPPDVRLSAVLALPVRSSDLLMPVARNVVKVAGTDVGQTVIYLAAEQQISLPRDVADLILSAIAERNRIAVSQLTATLGRDHGLAAADSLVRAGLVEVDPSSRQ